MAQKVNPRVFRIGRNLQWSINYCGNKNEEFLWVDQNIKIVNIFKNNFSNGIAEVKIERSVSSIDIFVETTNISFLNNNLSNFTQKVRKIIGKIPANIHLKEIKNVFSSAEAVSQLIASKIQSRAFYKGVIKAALSSISYNYKDVKSAKIVISGRLNGSEIARTEKFTSNNGKMPLSTISSIIDYGFCESKTKFGMIGIKVYLYKGSDLDQYKSRKIIERNKK